jgi:hypothetical protein
MPVGPFKTFDECVVAQKAKGHDEESAKRICGEIEKRANQSEEGESNAKFFDRSSRKWIPIVIR